MITSKAMIKLVMVPLLLSLILGLVAIPVLSPGDSKVYASNAYEPLNVQFQPNAPGIVANLSITSVNGITYVPGASVLYASPLNIVGNVSVTNMIGQLDSYHIKIDWGDGFVTHDISLNLQSRPDGSYFSTWQTPVPGHKYATIGNKPVIVSFYHSQPSGAEEAVASFPLMAYISQLATKIEFTQQPMGGAVNIPITPAPAVTIFDGGNNIVTLGNYSVSLSLGQNTTGATLSGTTTVNTTGGTAIFNGLKIDKTGTYTLIANCTAGAFTATSNPFTVYRFPMTVLGNFTADDKVYDGTTAATIHMTGASLDPTKIQAGYTDIQLDTTQATGSFADKNFGTGKTVIITGLVLTGSNAPAYYLQPPTTTANITAIPITVSAVTVNKAYDGNTSSPIVPAITAGNLGTGDTAAFIQTFDNKEVGTNKTLTPSGLVNDGNSGNNYLYTFVPVGTGSITAKTLTVTGITAANKVYDGTTSVTLGYTSAALVGVIAPDTVTLVTTGSSANFDTKDVGTGKTATISGLTISGGSATNYSLAQPTTTTANIAALPLTVTGITAVNKVYDGTTAATLTYNSAALVGVIAPDVVHLVTTGASATFADAVVGDGKAVTANGLSVDNTNYSLSQPTGLTASITAAYYGGGGGGGGGGYIAPVVTPTPTQAPISTEVPNPLPTIYPPEGSGIGSMSAPATPSPTPKPISTVVSVLSNNTPMPNSTETPSAPAPSAPFSWWWLLILLIILIIAGIWYYLNSRRKNAA